MLLRDGGVNKLNVIFQRGRDGVRECTDDSVSSLAVSECREVSIKKGVRLFDGCRDADPVASRRSLRRFKSVLR